MERLSDKQIISLVESITADDFCEDLNCRIAFEEAMSYSKTREMLEEADNKLSLIYRIVHSHNEKHKCFDKHNAWRDEAVEKYKEAAKEDPWYE